MVNVAFKTPIKFPVSFNFAYVVTLTLNAGENTFVTWHNKELFNTYFTPIVHGTSGEQYGGNFFYIAIGK